MHLYSYLVLGCQTLNNLYFFPWALRQMIGCLFLWLRDCLVEKADLFCETSLVVSPATFFDALLPDVPGDWLLDYDETRDF